MGEPRVYLSHPIRGIRGKDATEEYQISNNERARQWAHQLELLGLDVYCPGEHDAFPRIAHQKGILTVEQILTIDCEILSQCDAMVLANWEGQVSSGMEVEHYHAKACQIPVYQMKSLSEAITTVKEVKDHYEAML